MEGGGLLSESTERLGVLRPLSLPPDGRAKTADRGGEESRGRAFPKRDGEAPVSLPGGASVPSAQGRECHPSSTDTSRWGPTTR